jgi:hypothetical protein
VPALVRPSMKSRYSKWRTLLARGRMQATRQPQHLTCNSSSDMRHAWGSFDQQCGAIKASVNRNAPLGSASGTGMLPG